MPLLCIEIGHYLVYGSLWVQFNRQTLLDEIHHRLWEWLLGSLLLGPLLGAAGALLTYTLVRSFRNRTKGATAAAQGDTIEKAGRR